MRTSIRLVLAGLPMIALMALAPQSASAQTKPTKASPALQKEFDGFIATFRNALKGNDAAAVTSMTKVPFYYPPDDKNIDADAFRSRAYPFYFTARNRACVQRTKAVYDRDNENNENFFITCGQHMFTFQKTSGGFKFTEVGVND